MKIKRNNKRKLLTLFAVLTITVAFSGINLISLGANIVGTTTDGEENDIDGIPDSPVLTIMSSALSNIDGSGSTYPVVAHQSYFNDSFNTVFSNLDVLSTFDVPCPTDTDFNTSEIYINVNNINAPNLTIISEQNITETHYLTFSYSSFITAVSFTVESSCYLENFSIYLYVNDVNDVNLATKVLSSNWNVGNNRNEPDYFDTVGTCTVSNDLQFNETDGWLGNFSNYFSPILLDPTTTDNNTFYIMVEEEDELISQFEWKGIRDADDAEGDDQLAYTRGGGVWNPILISGGTVDLSLKVDLAPLNNNPSPEDINMEINGSAVLNGAANDGSVSIPGQFGESDGDLTFQINAGWWNVSCDVTEVQINYTKTNLLASSSFSVPGSGQVVEWNSSVIGGISGFDTDTPNSQYVNFTVPTHWTNEIASDGTSNKTTTSWDSSGGTTIFTAWDANDSPNWYLLADSVNLLQQINSSLGVSNLNEFDYGNTIDFTANFSEGIGDGTSINLTVYRPDDSVNFSLNVAPPGSPESQVTLYSWDTGTGLSPYGTYLVQVFWNNDTDAGFLEKEITILGITTLELTSHAGDDIQKFREDAAFNVTFYYNDTGINEGISTPNATYQIKGGDIRYLSNIPLGSGWYNLTLDPTDAGLFDYGPNEILVKFNRTNFHNQSLSFTLSIVNSTALNHWDASLNYGVTNYENVTHTFYYNDTAHDDPISSGCVIDVVPEHGGFGWFVFNHTDGNYTIDIEVNDVPVRSSEYWVNISIEKAGYRKLNFTLLITISNMSTNINGWGASTNLGNIYNYENATYSFYFNDTMHDLPISSGVVFTIDVGGYNFDYFVFNHTDGNYTINLYVNNVAASPTPYQIDVTLKRPGYVSQSFSLSLTVYLINITCEFVSDISDSYPRSTLDDYSAFLYVNLTGTPTRAEDLLSSDVEATYDGGTSWAGNITLTPEGFGYRLNLSIASAVSRNYYITINISRSGVFNWTITYLNFTLVGNYSTVTDFTLSVGATTLYEIAGRYNATEGATLQYTFRFYDENTSTYLTGDPGYTITVIYNGGGSSLSATIAPGDPVFGTINTDTLPDVGNYTIVITVTATNYEPATFQFEIEMMEGANPGPDGIPFEDLLIWLILIGILLGAVASIVGIQKGVVAPKKRAKSRALVEVQSVFDDAVNLEHVLVLYKASGMCVFFKSFGLESIDPELISGFLSAVSSFGREMESQQALNEIRYGDKQILLSDGKHIRVALVLTKKPSVITRQHLTEFIAKFERNFSKVLPVWKGNLRSFQGAGRLVDDILNTSIILPHEIRATSKTVKTITRQISKDVLKTAKNIVKNSDRKYFFIAQLLTLAVEQLKTEKAKVFMGIKELRDRNILVAIDITQIEAQPISQQEMNLIRQKVSQLPNVSPEMRQKLVEDLASMKNPAEREAFLASMAEHQEIVSMPVGGSSPIDVKDVKSAKKVISTLKRKAQSFKSKKDYKNSLIVLNNAAIVATSWELQKQHDLIKDEMRIIQMIDQEAKMRTYEAQAKKAVKAAKYKEAARFYELASKAASEAFKLGRNELMREVKRLTNKQKECEKRTE
ncbi:MAG: hypothetical protein ACFFAS_04025 [Promethearchaeota archaeon]